MLLGLGNSSLLREFLHLFGQKPLSERERVEHGAAEMKVFTHGKIVPYKCCPPSLNISVKKDFDTDSFNFHHTLSGHVCNVY